MKPIRSPRAGFTLLELLTVIAIIIVLAGLIISGMGYAQQKAAGSRAKAEIAAFSAALESYKADNGDYPRYKLEKDGSDWVVPTAATSPTDALASTATGAASGYAAASVVLYQALSGDYTLDGKPNGEGKVYFEFKPDMYTLTGSVVSSLNDPFGNPYGYSTKFNKGGTDGYNPTFDLWSTGGQSGSGATNNNPVKWITNW